MREGQESLIRLFEITSRYEVMPKPVVGGSAMGGGALAWALREANPLTRNDLQFASAAMGVWLCSNALPLFIEVEKFIFSSGAAHQLSPLALTQRLLDYFATETQAASATERAGYLADVMIATGLGLSAKSKNWDNVLRTLACDRNKSLNTNATRKLIEWAFDVETGEKRSEADLEALLDVMLRSSGEMTGFDLNQWAYFLLRLELFLAARPLAKRALEMAGTPDFFPQPTGANVTDTAYRCSVGICQDTYAWALCYAGKYADARILLESALRYFQVDQSEWYEVQYHRAHATYWSGEHEEAKNIILAMRNAGIENVWTKRAAHLIAERNPAERQPPSTRYDVIISFAGEDRPYACNLATKLQASGFSVFYDDFERAALWGENLYEYLTDIYQNKGRYCVVLVSSHYARKRWTRLEWRAIQARCFREQSPYCLPVRLDEAELPGLLPTVAYLSLERDGLNAIAEAVVQKLKEM